MGNPSLKSGNGAALFSTYSTPLSMVAQNVALSSPQYKMNQSNLKETRSTHAKKSEAYLGPPVESLE